MMRRKGAGCITAISPSGECNREQTPQARTDTVMTDWEGLQQAADMREAGQVRQTAGARGE